MIEKKSFDMDMFIINSIKEWNEICDCVTITNTCICDEPNDCRTLFTSEYEIVRRTHNDAKGIMCTVDQIYD
jgi:hypothetical protein